MLTSQPRPKRRGRQPPDYGPRRCPLDYLKLRLGAHGLFCASGWKERV